MRKYNLYLILMLGLLLHACKHEKPTTSFKIKLKDSGSSDLQVYNIENEVYETLSKTRDSFSLDLDKELILNLAQGRINNYVHLKPGQQISVETISESPTIMGVSDSPSKENEYLTAFSTLIAKQSETFKTPELCKTGVDTFLTEVTKKFEPLTDLVKEVQGDTDLSEHFKSALEHRLRASIGNDLLNYRPIYKYWNKKYPELPEDFYADIESLDFGNPALLIFEEGRQLGDSWHSKDIDYEDFESTSDYFNALGKSANDKYTNTLLGDYCKYNLTSNQINYGTGIDGAEDMVNDFRANVTNKYLNEKLDETIQPWLKLKSGSNAPNFDAQKRDGSSVQLADLKGKKVYVDVWATWCGPCVAEIPALKELESTLHDENIEFVSVSIDKDKDKEKWLKFIEDKEMTGLQLMAKGAWQSDIATSYNIKGIPRFLIIDEAGKIQSANAPRPSDPSIKDALMN